uniref:Uncharacterized protein n=1 Tax=Aegilops tauschii subsp. strangulata TaxID=200361 RepID=A0A453QCF1_AEGTS
DETGLKEILRAQNGKGETVLHEAIRLEDKDMVGVLLSADSQLARVPLADGASPLYLALLLGLGDIARQLFEGDQELSYSGPDGQNAFHAAILGRQAKGIYLQLIFFSHIVRLLCKFFSTSCFDFKCLIIW